MTKSKRIIINTLATYGRSVFALVVGVFSSRWLLQGLGAEDLGLFGVIGSLIGVVVILETVMQTAVARFYAYAIGGARSTSLDRGLDEVRRWFNVVFLIYTLLPLLVVSIGYPVGSFAIRYWLIIPKERMEACLYVFRCSMVATFISMISVPFVAMYQAHQEIVELSLFAMFRTIVNFFFTFSLLYVTCDRLKYAGMFGMVVVVVILSVQMLRSYLRFPECRVKLAYLFDFKRLRQILQFFFWEFFSCVGNMTRQQGSAIVTNKYFGPTVNAAWSIANTLSGQATALSSALVGALMPAVTAEEGAGEREKMTEMAFRTSKFSSLLILVFSIPLIVEMDSVLNLWLVNPPPYTNALCSCILSAYAIDKLGLGHHVAISAIGKIGCYHGIVGTTFLLSIPIAIWLIALGFGPKSIGYMFVVIYALVLVERIILARFLAGMTIKDTTTRIIIPIGLLVVLSVLLSSFVVITMQPSFLRIVMTTFVALSSIGLICWGILLDVKERAFILNGIRKFFYNR